MDKGRKREEEVKEGNEGRKEGRKGGRKERRKEESRRGEKMRK